jgi:hypothetical protein
MLKSVSHILSGFIVVLCLVMAGFFLFTDLMIDKLYGTRRNILTGVMLLYAVFRFFRIKNALNKENNENNETTT